jgi:hypothetical protein
MRGFWKNGGRREKQRERACRFGFPPGERVGYSSTSTVCTASGARRRRRRTIRGSGK